MNLPDYFCPDCGCRVKVMQWDDPSTREFRVCVTLHDLRYDFVIDDLRRLCPGLLEEVMHSKTQEAIQEIRKTAHPVGKVQYAGPIPEGMPSYAYIKVPVTPSRASLATWLDKSGANADVVSPYPPVLGIATTNVAAGDLVVVQPLQPPRPAYPPVRKIHCPPTSGGPAGG